jgi:hypothetical protein
VVDGHKINHLSADDNTLAAGGLVLVDVLVLGRAVGRVIRVSAAGASAVEPDAVTGAGDAEAFARAAAGAGADAARRRRVGRAGSERWDIRLLIGIVVGLVLGLVVGDGLVRELVGEGLEGSLVVLAVDDLASLVGTFGPGSDDPGGRQRAALGDRGSADAAGVAGGLLGRRGGLGGLSWDIEDVELAASGGLGGVLLGGIVGNVVAVNDVVVPVSLTLLQGSALEFEAADPSAVLLGVLGKGKLSGVVVPGAEQVHGLAVVGSAESEVELDSGHCGDLWISKVFG